LLPPLVVAGLLFVRVMAPSIAYAAEPTLQRTKVIRTTPFTGTSTSMRDGEGSAYVPRDDTLWLADDNANRVYRVDRESGALEQTITTSQLENAPKYGGGPVAGPNRVGDLESLAYDAGADVLYAFSGSCCSTSALPTAFRLTRGSGATFQVESYQPLAAGTNPTAAAVRPSTGYIYVGAEAAVRRYIYTSNSFSSSIALPVGSILGMGFSSDGVDLYVVTKAEQLHRIDWASRTLVSGWSFDLTPFEIRDSRAVERVGNNFYVLDGYDARPDGDPLKYGVFVLNVSTK
jgi:hypothetical protein